MRIFISVIAFTILAACTSEDETVAAYGGDIHTWRLTELDGVEITYATRMTFAHQGSVDGEGPCNPFTATQRSPYPWFELDPFISVDDFCSKLDQETEFFDALQAMSVSEVVGDTMILSNDAGREMVFKATSGDV